MYKYFKTVKITLSLFISLLFIFISLSCEKISDSEVVSSNEKTNLKINRIENLDEYAHLKSGDIIPDRFIILLSDDNKINEFRNYQLTLIKQKKDEMKSYISSKVSTIISENFISEYEISDIYYSVLQGFAIRIKNIEDVNKLKVDKRIRSIKNDVLIKLESDNKLNKPQKTLLEEQYIPWGVKRVGGPFDGTQAPRKAWIIDSGIDMDHPDLNVDQSLSTYFVGSSPNDCANHGTLVAGVIGAKNNNIGVVGVAAGARVVSVRCFDCAGHALASTAISGVQYVINHGQAGDVINCSWGWRFTNPDHNANISFALYSAAQLGFWITIAAGNDRANVSSYVPAGGIGHLNSFVLSGIDSTDNWYYWSNYGTSVNFSLPAVNILSTSMNDGYATMSGTSFAAPTMAGMILYYYGFGYTYSDMFKVTGYARNDPDGNADKIPSIKNTIVENFNDQQIYDNQPCKWTTPYPYNTYPGVSAANRYLSLGGSVTNPPNYMFGCTESLNRSIGGIYISFNIKINSHGTSDSWAAIHMLKNHYNDVPINDGYWPVSGIPITFKKTGALI